ncbi:MAG: hypothetical protein H8D78_17290 [Chloroflexi bacterium]|nr:hypothetical protein [Chloroflexota bacterium]
MLQSPTSAQATWPNGNWPEVLHEYGVQFLILDRRHDSDLLGLFQTQPGWTVDFEDEEAVIFARATPAQPTTIPIP